MRSYAFGLGRFCKTLKTREKEIIDQRLHHSTQSSLDGPWTRRSPEGSVPHSTTRLSRNCASLPGEAASSNKTASSTPIRPRTGPTDAPAGGKASAPHPTLTSQHHKRQNHDRSVQLRTDGRAPPRRAAVDGGGLPAARRRAAHDARHSQSVVRRFDVGQWTAGLRLKICSTRPARPQVRVGFGRRPLLRAFCDVAGVAVNRFASARCSGRGDWLLCFYSTNFVC